MYMVNYSPIKDDETLVYAVIKTDYNFQVVEYDTDKEEILKVLFDGEKGDYYNYQIAHTVFMGLIGGN